LNLIFIQWQNATPYLLVDSRLSEHYIPKKSLCVNLVENGHNQPGDLQEDSSRRYSYQQLVAVINSMRQQLGFPIECTLRARLDLRHTNHNVGALPPEYFYGAELIPAEKLLADPRFIALKLLQNFKVLGVLIYGL